MTLPRPLPQRLCSGRELPPGLANSHVLLHSVLSELPGKQVTRDQGEAMDVWRGCCSLGLCQWFESFPAKTFKHCAAKVMPRREAVSYGVRGPLTTRVPVGA